MGIWQGKSLFFNFFFYYGEFKAKIKTGNWDYYVTVQVLAPSGVDINLLYSYANVLFKDFQPASIVKVDHHPLKIFFNTNAKLWIMWMIDF